MMNKELTSLIDLAGAILKAAGAKEVYLFGSAATGTLREGSDIDLAVLGLPPGIFFRTMGQVSCAINRPIDLVDLDEDTPFTRYLREEGELVRVA
ncbi:MAG: nucleotidyltransferase domain-containing protein [Thermodesulfobacteriota bacterium]